MVSHHGGGAKGKAGTCKVSRDLGLEQACLSRCHLLNMANSEVCLDAVGAKGLTLFIENRKDMDMGGGREPGERQVSLSPPSRTPASLSPSPAPPPPPGALRPHACILHHAWFFLSGRCEYISHSTPRIECQGRPISLREGGRTARSLSAGRKWNPARSAHLAKVTQLGCREVQPPPGGQMCTSTASAKMAGLSFAFCVCTELKASSFAGSLPGSGLLRIWRRPASPLALN